MEPVVATPFTPWLSLLGGVLIGLAAVMVMGLFGKIAGITGISKGLTSAVIGTGGPTDRGWRVAFLLGLVAAPLAVLLATWSFPQQTVPTNLWGMALAGFLVGFGTAFGSGCTSGHGVCGLARLSPRSGAAVATFLVAASRRPPSSATSSRETRHAQRHGILGRADLRHRADRVGHVRPGEGAELPGHTGAVGSQPRLRDGRRVGDRLPGLSSGLAARRARAG